jgi:hypothetical protein
MSILFTVPEICITLAPESETAASSSNLSSPVDTQNAPPVIHNGRLGVPPPTVDYPSRRTLVQRGLHVGSHRLNCAESFQTPRGFADIATTRRTFNWSRSPLANVPTTRSQRGHMRARSLNSLADLNDCLKMGGVNTINKSHHHHHRTEYSDPVRKSIDLSVLSSKALTSSSDFAFAL